MTTTDSGCTNNDGGCSTNLATSHDGGYNTNLGASRGQRTGSGGRGRNEEEEPPRQLPVHAVQILRANSQAALSTHIMRGEASAEDLLIHLAISAHGKKRRGPKIQTKSGGTVPGRKIRWCSYEGYTKWTPYLHDHLKNVHGVKPKATLMWL